MEELAPPVRNWRRWAAIALVALAVAVTAYLVLDRRMQDRIAAGRPVTAVVTDVLNLRFDRAPYRQLVTVRYDLDGRHTVRLGSFGEGRHRAGDTVTVYAEPGDPESVATTDGFASEGLALTVVPIVAFYGAVALIAIAFRRGRWWWRHERTAPTRVPVLTVEPIALVSKSGPAWRAEMVRIGQTDEPTEEGGLRLVVVLDVGGAGEPKALHWSRRSRRLVVTVPVPADMSVQEPERPLREGVEAGVRFAEQWGRKRGKDVTALLDAARRHPAMES